MRVRPIDIAPVGPAGLPDSGLGRGWEAAAVMGLTILVLTFGLVTLYSASSVFALSQGLSDTFYVTRQGAGALFGLACLLLCAWMPYRYWELFAWPLVFVSVGMLVLCILPWTTGIAPSASAGIGGNVRRSKRELGGRSWKTEEASRTSSRCVLSTAGLAGFWSESWSV